MTTDLLVLGGGIKGAALSALASAHGHRVTLIERDDIAAGTTSTNHGRLHLGTAGWRRDPPALVRRRRHGAELMWRLPNVVAGQRPALYLFDDETDGRAFRRFAAASRLPVRPADPHALDHPWVTPGRYVRAFELPEFSFDPARLAGRFAQTCVALGGTVRPHADARRVSVRPGGVVVTFADGEELVADVVVNALSRWSNNPVAPPGFPRFDVRWFRWRLLCLRTQALAPQDHLDRIVVVMDRARAGPNAIPHHGWLTLDAAATEVREVETPESNGPADWRPVRDADAIDQAILGSVAEAFRPVRERAIGRDAENLFALAGIQGRLTGAPPGSSHRLLAADTAPGYFVAFGGQASTALADAAGVLAELGRRGYCRPVRTTRAVDALARALAPEPLAGSRPMRWDEPG